MEENTGLREEVNSLKKQLAAMQPAMRNNLNDRWLGDVLRLIDHHNDDVCGGVDVCEEHLAEITGEVRMEEINRMSLGEKQRIVPTLCSLGFHIITWEDEGEDDDCPMTVDWCLTANETAKFFSGKAFRGGPRSYHSPTGPLDPRFSR
jgi:hypothetical protein